MTLRETPSLLDVNSLSIQLPGNIGLVRDVSFSVRPAETVALVGESGCGKSVTALAIMGVLPPNLHYGQGSSIQLEGTEMVGLDPARLRKLRGNRISMIFQNPLTALNPVMTIRAQITEVLREHRAMSLADASDRAVELLRLVRIPDPSARLHDYPHRLSGGMRQRVMIAMALACDPVLLVADEPTTALDVTVQVQILDLLRELQAETGLGLVLITHDLGVVSRYCDTVQVMYAGSIVERGPAAAVLERPAHPYTKGLLSARPDTSYWLSGRKLHEIPGGVPAPDKRPAGCAFHTRCEHVSSQCSSTNPALTGNARGVRCFNPLTSVG